MFKIFLAALLILASCNGRMKSEISDDELLNLKPIQTQAIKKASDESWTNETRSSYASYYYLLGEYLGLEHNFIESEEVLELANELDPNEFVALKVLLAKVTIGKEEEVKNELEKLVIKYPQSARFHSLYAVLLSKLGSYDMAISEFEKSISLDPSEEKNYLQLIAIYQQQNANDKAFKTCKRLSVAIPRSAQAHLLLAHFYQEQGQHKQALISAEQAYQLNPSNAEIVLFYAQILELSGDNAKAVTLYDQLFSENPSLEELLGKTLALYKTFGDLNEIYKRLETMAEATKHKSIGIEIQKALVLWELSRNLEALNVLLQLQKVYPDSEQILYLTGLAHEKLGDFTSAIAQYNRVREDSTFYLPANFQSLRVLDAQKDYTSAYLVIQKLAKSRYVIAEVYSIGANLYAKENKFAEAIGFLREGYKKFPDQLQLLFLVGVFQEKSNQIDDCVQTMKEVIRKDPNNSSALNYLGYIWAERGIKLDIAQSLIERALSIKPNDGFYLDSLAWVFYQKGDFPKALEMLNNAIKVEPEEGIIVEHLGDVYLKMGKTESALQTYEQAIKKSNLEAKDKNRIQEKITKLKNRKEA